MKTEEKTLTVMSPNGVHSRVATKLAQIGDRNKARLNIIYDGEVVDCSSVLDVLAMSFTYGTSFIVRVYGRDPEKVMKEVEKAINGSDED